MLTKKDKLLTRPWIVQRYNNHRKKVQSAGPAIDFYPPTVHPHVTLKLKKIQKETERKSVIEKENVRLLQRLGAIMNKKRLENFWQYTRPNFLNREFLYRPSKVHPSSASDQIHETRKWKMETQSSAPLRGSSARCSACNGRPIKRNEMIPEERVPWAPPRKSWNKKILNDSTEIHVCCRYCC